MSEEVKPSDARSPMAGCAILIVALLVMVFLIAFSTLTLFRQYDAIAKFTDEAPRALEVTALDGKEGEINALARKLEVFRQHLLEAEEARLELTPDELNLAVAVYEPFKELRGTFRIESCEGERMRIGISFPLNGKPRLADEGESGWIASDMRYLNATVVAEPCLLKQEVVLRLHEIQVPDREVPVEFVQQMSPYRLMERYLTDATLGPAMAGLTSVAIVDGKLVLAKVPGEKPVDAFSQEEVEHGVSRLLKILGTVACLFLVFAGTVVFIGLRKKRPDA